MRSFLAGLLVLAARCCRARADDLTTDDATALEARAADGQLRFEPDKRLLTFYYSTDTPDKKNWIGIYDFGKGPEKQTYPGNGSLLWRRAPDPSGELLILNENEKLIVGKWYQAFYLAKDQYSWLADPVKFKFPDEVQSSSSSSSSSQSSTTPPTSSTPAQATPAPPPDTNKTALGVGLGVGLGICLIGVFGLVLFVLRQRRKKKAGKGAAPPDKMSSGGDIYREIQPGSNYDSSVGLSPETPYQPIPVQLPQYPPPTHAPSYQQTPTEFKATTTGNPSELPAGNVPLELPVPHQRR